MKKGWLFLVIFFCLRTTGQDSIRPLKAVFFPGPTEKKSQFAIGFISTTMPYDVTEELHFRVPAIDVRLVKRLSKKLALDMHAGLQVFQNLFTIGPRWTTPLNERWSIGIGNDVGYWFGAVNVESVKTRGRGFQNVPNLSIGRRFNRRVLLTFRADAQMNFGIRTFAKETELTTDHKVLSGSSYTLILEQPFYGNKVLGVGLRGVYTDFFWQTWTLFETFDRNLFYPQVIVNLNL
jgi:hypothetical protein